jgi:hypothetical protein
MFDRLTRSLKPDQAARPFGHQDPEPVRPPDEGTFLEQIDRRLDSVRADLDKKVGWRLDQITQDLDGGQAAYSELAEAQQAVYRQRAAQQPRDPGPVSG